MSDWKHLLPDCPEVHQLHDNLMDDLKEIVEAVDALNETAPCPKRPHASQTFNPKFFECSVSV